jgi:hypothetical protein
LSAALYHLRKRHSPEARLSAYSLADCICLRDTCICSASARFFEVNVYQVNEFLSLQFSAKCDILPNYLFNE